MTEAYCYRDGKGVLDLRTLMPTKKGAQVNVIVTASFGHVVPQDHWTDEAIDHAFINATGGEGRVVRVIVTPAE